MGNDINKIWSFKAGPAGAKRAAYRGLDAGDKREKETSQMKTC